MRLETKVDIMLAVVVAAVIGANLFQVLEIGTIICIAVAVGFAYEGGKWRGRMKGYTEGLQDMVDLIINEKDKRNETD